MSDKRPLLDELREAQQQGCALIGDGAMGTQLQRAGLEPGACGEEWNLSHPQRVLAIQRAYAESGSQVLLTNTFGANRFVLARHSMENRLAEICRAAAGIARQAVGDNGWVIGDVGPCGGFLEPMGEIPAARLEASLREQIGALLEGGVDAILVETISALDELELGIRVARQMGTGCVIASLAFDRRRAGYRTMTGASPEQAAACAVAAGAHVVGANCGTGLDPADFLEIARAYRAACNLPLMLQPNAGRPDLVAGQAVYPLSPDQMAPMLAELAGVAQVVGGCCGTTPAHIAAFSKVQSLSKISSQRH